MTEMDRGSPGHPDRWPRRQITSLDFLPFIKQPKAKSNLTLQRSSSEVIVPVEEEFTISQS